MARPLLMRRYTPFHETTSRTPPRGAKTALIATQASPPVQRGSRGATHLGPGGNEQTTRPQPERDEEQGWQVDPSTVLDRAMSNGRNVVLGRDSGLNRRRGQEGSEGAKGASRC